MLLVCWNVAGRVRRLSRQAELVLQGGADIVCLQELSASTLPVWHALLAEAGYRSVHAGELDRAPRRRPLAVLTACRTDATVVPVAGIPWSERVLAVRLAQGLEIVNAHSPISPAPGLAKVLTHEALFAHLARRRRHPRLLCGDLNTPRREHADGTVWTFARDRYGRLRADRGERWDAAELLLIRGLERYGFRDAFRALHGPERREISWAWARWPGGYRIDHLLAARVEVVECRYEHSWREEGLSDHSPLIARVHEASHRGASGR